MLIDRKFSRFCCIVFAIFLFESVAVAQRGEDYSRKVEVAELPLSGYPGYFDTNLANEKEFVADFPPVIGGAPFPVAFVDYGLNEKTTIGTNALGTLLPLLMGGFGLAGKLRSLLYGTETFQNTVTLYGGYMMMKLPQDTSSNDSEREIDEDLISSEFGINYQYFTNNMAWVLSERQILTGQVGAGRINISQGRPDKINYVDMNVWLGVLGLSYQYHLNGGYGFEAAALAPIFQKLSADTAGAGIAVESRSVSDQNLLFRVLRVSGHMIVADNWLFNLGIVNMSPLIDTNLWFGTAVRW